MPEPSTSQHTEVSTYSKEEEKKNPNPNPVSSTPALSYI